MKYWFTRKRCSFFEKFTTFAVKKQIISGESVSDHFADVGKMVEIGSGAKKEIDDILLTRYVCFLVAQNDDKGFALIRSKGDKALFRLDTAQLKRKFNVPENLPPAEDVKKVERRLNTEKEKALKQNRK